MTDQPPGIILGSVVAAGISDWLDGYVARRWNMSSVLGSYLDPIGDKAFVASVALALAAKGVLPAWLAACVLVRRKRTLGSRRAGAPPSYDLHGMSGVVDRVVEGGVKRGALRSGEGCGADSGGELPASAGARVAVGNVGAVLRRGGRGRRR